MDGNVDENSVCVTIQLHGFYITNKLTKVYVISSKMINMHTRYVEEPYIQVMFRILVGYRIGGKFVRSLIGG